MYKEFGIYKHPEHGDNITLHCDDDGMYRFNVDGKTKIRMTLEDGSLDGWIAIKRYKDEPKEEVDFSFWNSMIEESWYKQLTGDGGKVRKEVYFAFWDLESLDNQISKFEEKYGRKLKYRIDELAYISFEETVVSGVYEDE